MMIWATIGSVWSRLISVANESSASTHFCGLSLP
jgi:hypothetical protein